MGVLCSMRYNTLSSKYFKTYTCNLFARARRRPAFILLLCIMLVNLCVMSIYLSESCIYNIIIGIRVFVWFDSVSPVVSYTDFVYKYTVLAYKLHTINI